MELAGQPDHVRAFPRLLADIGGTNVRLALQDANGDLQALAVLPQKSHSSLSAAMRVYLSHSAAIAAGASAVREAAFAIANPVDGDRVQMTNAAWAFSVEALKREFGFDRLLLVNDFTALALALPRLRADQLRQVGGGTAILHGTIGLLGPGTGLGVSGLIPAGDGWVPLTSEGGHVSFSPANEREADVLRFVWQKFPHVSAERLLSGSGLALLYRAVAHLAAEAAEPFEAPEITRRALAQECALCDETVELFCAMLGTVAGNLALTLGAKGGIYIGGGIVPRLGERFDCSGFRRRFEQKGRFSAYLAAIPTLVITAEHPGLIGVAAMLEENPAV